MVSVSVSTDRVQTRNDRQATAQDAAATARDRIAVENYKIETAAASAAAVAAAASAAISATAIGAVALRVWQVRVALANASKFHDVNNAIGVSPGGLVYEAWSSGGAYTYVGDGLYDEIVDAIGSSAANAAYAAALLVTL